MEDSPWAAGQPNSPLVRFKAVEEEPTSLVLPVLLVGFAELAEQVPLEDEARILGRFSHLDDVQGPSATGLF